MNQPPIEPKNYLTGVTVVDIGDMRVKRGMTRRSPSLCPHKNMHYDKEERRIQCPDCEEDIDPFDAFVQLVGSYDRAAKGIMRRHEELMEAENSALISIAARNVDKEWRKARTVPACPHCERGLLADDFKAGFATVSKEIEIERRRFE